MQRSYRLRDKFDYSNIGYGVLDHAIRDVSGVTYAEYMRREIFQPLGMKSAFVEVYFSF